MNFWRRGADTLGRETADTAPRLRFCEKKTKLFSLCLCVSVVKSDHTQSAPPHSIPYLTRKNACSLRGRVPASSCQVKIRHTVRSSTGWTQLSTA
jgi:hypothetical protein